MNQPTAAANRLIALDVFRGLTIALMFIVNNPGTWNDDLIYAPLQHAKWHGWTPTDFVFPFFLFTVGVSAAFSLKKYVGKAPRALYIKIIRRGITIFLIGLALNLFLNSLASYERLRIMGVLQRIGIAYLLGSLICVTFPPRIVAILGGVLLIGYWFLMANTGDPSYPLGFYDALQHKFLGIENNIVTKVDLSLLGASHLYKGYGGIPFDPEGLLSTIPAVVTVFLGYFTGKLIDSEANRPILTRKMLVWGIAALSLGWFWGNEQILGKFAFPINKPIWSSSYVVFMAGWCLVINAFLIYLIDVKGWRGWTKPVLVLGMNSMLAFVVAGAYVKLISKVKFDSSYETVTQKWDNQTSPKRIGGYQKLWEDVFSPITTPRTMLTDFKEKRLSRDSGAAYQDFAARQKLASFCFALFHVVLFWFILWIFYRNNIFLKV